jgi:hypothetical protein
MRRRAGLWRSRTGSCQTAGGGALVSSDVVSARTLWHPEPGRRRCPAALSNWRERASSGRRASTRRLGRSRRPCCGSLASLRSQVEIAARRPNPISAAPTAAENRCRGARGAGYRPSESSLAGPRRDLGGGGGDRYGADALAPCRDGTRVRDGSSRSRSRGKKAWSCSGGSGLRSRMESNGAAHAPGRRYLTWAGLNSSRTRRRFGCPDRRTRAR